MAFTDAPIRTKEVLTEAEFSMTKEQEAWVISIMLSVTVVKLALAVYCRSFTNEIVKAYAQEHLFDVITNVLGLIAALLANYLRDWMDPVGAILLALYTIRTWSFTVLVNVNSFVGKSAAPKNLQNFAFHKWNVRICHKVGVVFSMLEASIGMHTDCGFSYLLSRLPGCMGLLELIWSCLDSLKEAMTPDVCIIQDTKRLS